MTLIKTEVQGIYRDTRNGALLNRDNEALTAYKKQKAKRLQLEQTVDRLENEMAEMKNVLSQILEKNK